MTSPASCPEASAVSLPATFRVSPLIRYTLLLLFVALTLPLPVFSVLQGEPMPLWLLLGGLAIGLSALLGALSEQVTLDQVGIQVTYAGWVPAWFRSGWSLAWSSITALKPRSTGQGGLVYYLVAQSEQGDQGYLLPMRVVGFARMLRLIEACSGIDTSAVKPLAQPWMYSVLLGCTLLLLLVDAWVLWTALNLQSLA
ncbi:hypothetical protein [Leptolyngbya sp. FACHB-261]|uniref:hypothetical protein n=1 Tax=Leptolyngbya sp. FACHB-261 TaxID=2692806 RepID=UPI001687F835|nr:hypothetical protein [Leptolyngbya sp. FACHB-261]MBD2105261.1 hypothetical protein [Leptolyngbya sp. FACHB-261]